MSKVIDTGNFRRDMDEIEYVEVLGDPCWIDGLQNRSHTMLNIPTENALNSAFVVLFYQCGDDWLDEKLLAEATNTRAT